MEQKADLLILGAGLAGLTCALEALGMGLRVTLLERDGPEGLGGLARHSFGGLLLVDTPQQMRNKVKDSPERAFADWCRFGEFGPGAEDALPRAWAAAYCEDSRPLLYDWLSGLGQRFLPVPLWVERNGNSVPRWHVCWGTGTGLVRVIRQAIETHPRRSLLRIEYGQRAEQLIVEAGRVTGAVAQDDNTGAAREFHAGRIVIASGGLNGAEALVRKYWDEAWQPAPPIILNGAHPNADGTLHFAAQAAGAQLHRLDRNWHYAGGIHHWNPSRPNHGLSTVPARSALWVNGQGARIMPPMVSGFDTRDLLARLCAQPGGYGWQIMNRKIALKELAASGAQMNPSIRNSKKIKFVRELLFGNHWLYRELTENCIDVVTAADLESLISQMQALSLEGISLDPAQFRSALEAYDAEVAKGPARSSDPQIQQIEILRGWRGDKLRLTRNQRILDPKAGPLVALRCFPIARKSLGGIATDLSTRVLDGAGTAIPGLYAVGECAGFGGGNMNGKRGLEGTFLGGALYCGRRFGRALAAGD